MAEAMAGLFGEDYCFAVLLRMVLEHCSTMQEGELKSFAIEANADAMQALSDAGFIQITESDGQQITAILLPEGSALAARFVRERDSEHR